MDARQIEHIRGVRGDGRRCFLALPRVVPAKTREWHENGHEDGGMRMREQWMNANANVNANGDGYECKLRATANTDVNM